MKKWERRAAAAFFLLAVGAAVKAVDIGFGDFRTPGPGFFPFWLAVILAVVAGVYYLANRGTDERAVPLWPAGGLKRPVAAVVVALIYIQVLDFLGFCSAAFFLFAAWQRAVEGKSWRQAALVAVVGSVCVYVVFVLLLQLPMPHGLLV